MWARPTSSPCSPSTGPAGRCSASASRRRSTPSRRQAVALARIDGLEPSWEATDLGQGLIDAVAAIEDVADSSERTGRMPRRIVLDQRPPARQPARGTGRVRMAVRRRARDQDRLRRLARTPACNGSPTRPRPWPPAPLASPASASSTTPNPAANGSPCNGPAPTGAELGDPIDVYVPPGESRVVRVPRPKGTAHGPGHRAQGRLRAPFDNTLYVVDEPKQEATVLFIGDDRADDPNGLLFYLMRVFIDTPRRTVKVVAPSADSRRVVSTRNTRPPWSSSPAETSPENARRLRANAQAGGTLLYVATRPGPGETLGDPDGCPGSSDRGGLVSARRPASARSPSITRCSRRSPARSTATSPRSTSGSTASCRVAGEARVLARFENGDPAVIEKPIGQGERGRHGQRMEPRRQPARRVRPSSSP